MSRILTGIRGDAPGTQFPFTVNGQASHGAIPMDESGSSPFKWVDPDASQQDQQPPTEFERQKEAFQTISQEELSQYAGEFVVSVNGQLVDSDDDFDALVERYFSAHGEHAPTYITQIPPVRSRITFDTPFV